MRFIIFQLTNVLVHGTMIAHVPFTLFRWLLVMAGLSILALLLWGLIDDRKADHAH